MLLENSAIWPVSHLLASGNESKLSAQSSIIDSSNITRTNTAAWKIIWVIHGIILVEVLLKLFPEKFFPLIIMQVAKVLLIMIQTRQTMEDNTGQMKEWILKICAEGGYDIGFTATGEWMKYNVNVTQAGTYTLQVRVATPNSNDSLHVEIDNVVVSGKIIVTNTGGYQNWQTVSVTTSALTVGTHIMRIYFATGGFNLEYLNFVYGTPLAAPSITSSTSVSSFIGSAFTYTTTASNNPASYSATNLPAGLSINTTTGVISGIAASMGTANVTINATNATGTGTAALSLTFNASTTESAYGGIIQIIPGEIIAANFDNGGQM